MDRFFRSGVFPLIVIVLLVSLASQTFMSDGPAKREVAYGWCVLVGGFFLVGLAIQLANRSRARAEEDLTAQVRNRSTA